jgi:hypothetical protein
MFILAHQFRPVTCDSDRPDATSKPHRARPPGVRGNRMECKRRVREWNMKRHVSLLLIAMTSMLAAQLISPATAQEYQPSEASHHDNLMPPRVDRVDVRARLFHSGMPGAHVERIMGAPAELQAYDGPGGNVRVLSYPTEPIATIVSINNGQLTGVRLDLAGIDEPTLPAYSRPVWLGMDRATVLRILGVPTDDQSHDSFGMKLEHLIFARPGQPDVSVFLIGGRVAGKKVGRDLPWDILGFALPLPPEPTKQETDAQSVARSEREVAVGMTMSEIQALFGTPKLSVDYTFKGRPASYRIYQTNENGSFGSFTFVDGVLIEFAGGGGIPLSQILNGG